MKITKDKLARWLLEREKEHRPGKPLQAVIITYHYPAWASDEVKDALRAAAKATYVAGHPEYEVRHPTICLGLGQDDEKIIH